MLSTSLSIAHTLQYHTLRKVTFLEYTTYRTIIIVLSNSSTCNSYIYTVSLLCFKVYNYIHLATQANFLFFEMVNKLYAI